MVSGTRQDNLFNIDHGKALAPHREAEDKFPLCRSLIRSLAIQIFGSPLFEGDGEPDYASLEFIYWRGLLGRDDRGDS